MKFRDLDLFRIFLDDSPSAQVVMRRAFFSTTKRKVSSSSFVSSKEGCYQSIGRFHSENLADALRVPGSDYTSPPLPFVPTLGDCSSGPYLLDKLWTF